MNEIKNEQELYERINQFRKELKTSALTRFDIYKFMDLQSNNEINPEQVFKQIIIGNACSWGSYERACEHYLKYMHAFNQYDLL